MTYLCTMHKFHFYFQHACNCSCLAVNSPSIRAQGNILVISPSKQIHFYIFHLLKCLAIEKTEGDTGFMKPICCTQARKILVVFFFVCLFVLLSMYFTDTTTSYHSLFCNHLQISLVTLNFKKKNFKNLMQSEPFQSCFAILYNNKKPETNHWTNNKETTT